MKIPFLCTLALLGAFAASSATAQGLYPQQSYLTASSVTPSPNDCVLADLDGDGMLEAAIANSYADLAVLRGLGVKGFGALTSYPTFPSQMGIAAGHLDNDALLDVVEVGFGIAAPGALSVQLGTPGGLSPGTVYNLDSVAFHARIADMDLDGNRDIVVPLLDIDKISIRLGDGAGSLTSNAVFPSEDEPFDVHVADMNGDGLPDALTACRSSSKVAIHLNVGPGGLAPPLSYGVQAKCYSLATADFNLDGKLDVAATAYVIGTANAVSVFLGNGDGTLLPPTNLTGPRLANYVSVADFNLDGKADILALGYTNSVHHAYMGNGQGAFTPSIQFYMLRMTGGDVGDLNLDGLLDVATTYDPGGRLRTRFGNGQGKFGEDIAEPSAQAISLADFDQDGNLDAVVAKGGGTLGIRSGDGGGGFAPLGPVYTFGSEDLSRVYSPDLDADSIPDVVIIGSPSNVHYGRNSGLGTFPAFSTLGGTSEPRGADFGDVNLDGNLDAVVANEGFNTISIHRGNGAGGFLPAAHILSGGSGTLDVKLRDLNGDGDPELIAVNSLSQVVGVGLGEHHAEFGAFTNYLCVPGTTVTLDVADLDNDGFPDLVTGNNFDGHVIVRVNNGAAQFPTKIDIFTAGTRLLLGDVNDDGNRDLLCLQAPEVRIALGDGTGNLTPGPRVDLSTGSNDLDVGDIDSDGRLDIVAVNASAPPPEGGSFKGTLTVLRSVLGVTPSTIPYGMGTPGCSATLGIAAEGLPLVNNAMFRLLTTNAPAFATGLGLVGNVKDHTGTDYLGLGFALHVNPFLSTELLAFDFRSDACGHATVAAPIPNNPVLVGAQYFVQTIWVQPGCPALPFDLASSRGLEITILP